MTAPALCVALPAAGRGGEAELTSEVQRPRRDPERAVMETEAGLAAVSEPTAKIPELKH